MNRENRDRRFYYRNVAERFELLDNPYDISRRLSVVFDDLLSEVELRDKLTLDLGCGYGAFSRAAVKKGAHLVSCDIVERLVSMATDRAGSAGVVGDAMQLCFVDQSFDVVITSEMLEHTERPLQAIYELARILKPGGLLVCTTPNKTWQWLVRAASFLRVRPFQGFENFLGWWELESIAGSVGLQLVKHVGFHPWPFQVKPLWRLSQLVDEHYGQGYWSTLMINQAVLARKAH